MKKIGFLDRRVGSIGMSFAVLLGVLVPGLVPMAVSADVLQSRSVAMTSTSADASGVNYTISFTAAHTFGSVIVDFCSDSPLRGETCTAPTGFNAASATVAFPTNGIGTVSTGSTPLATTAAHVVALGTSSGSAAATVMTLTGVHNPTAAGALYARVYTYASNSPDYTSLTAPGTTADDGGLATSITQAIGVTAAVRETLVFCVSGVAPGPTCGTTGAVVTDPSLNLGEGSPKALDSTHVSTGTNYSQISTNAAHGVVVNLKNGNACGGLKLAAATGCDIPAAGDTAVAIAFGTAKFGVKLGTEVVGGSGSLTYDATYSDATNYGMGYTTATPGTGVSSDYGDTLYSATGPVNNIGVPMTFAAAISNDTPAGNYSASMNLIATGTY
jgi:hypothetical protein